MKYKDYYEVMGVERGASAKEIKSAYRKLAHRYHPDVSKDPKGEEKFKDIAEAYATLKDPEKRRAYDELGRRPAGESFTPPPQWQQHFHTDEGSFDDVDLADLLASFGRGAAGARARRAGPRRGQDFEIVAPVSLLQIHRGGELEVSAQLPQIDEHGVPHRVARTFQITIPKGAADGQRLRLAGQGGAGTDGGPPGDLYVALSLEPHPLFRVSGSDLYIDVPLAPWEAVLGAQVEIPTLDGSVELTIKPGTAAGQKLRLGKRGLASADGDSGSLYATIRIEVPKEVSAHERELYQQLAASSRFSPRRHLAEGVH